MKIIYSALICSLVYVSCNQGKLKSSESDISATEAVSKSEYKDSTSFKKGVKVFIKPTSQIKFIDDVTVVNGNTVFLVDGRKYKSSDLKSLE